MVKGLCVLYIEVFYYDEFVGNCMIIIFKSYCVFNFSIFVRNICVKVIYN